MRLIAPLFVLAVALSLLLSTPPNAKIIGLDHQAFAAASMLAALLIALSSWARPADVARALGAAVVWAALLIALTAVYAYRFEASDFVGRVTAELFPSEPEVGQ
jgi:predicted aspartyl protease